MTLPGKRRISVIGAGKMGCVQDGNPERTSQLEGEVIEERLRTVHAKEIQIPREYHRRSLTQRLDGGHEMETDSLRGYVAAEDLRLGFGAPCNDTPPNLKKSRRDKRVDGIGKP